jgi:prevent-host-death family protein
MKTVNVHEAKTHLSRILRRVMSGEEVLITNAGEPVARLVPVDRPQVRVLGRDRGLFTVPEDFDDPLPADVLSDFEP